MGDFIEVFKVNEDNYYKNGIKYTKQIQEKFIQK